MADHHAITLYTSIPPKLRRIAADIEYGDAYQKECINSWISGGFRVVSINRRSEIEYLKNKYRQVRFVDSGSEDARTKIHVFFRNIAADDESVSGIINADCYLLNCYAIANTVRASSHESIVLLRRLDIDCKALRPMRGKNLGFDGFLFDTSFLRRIEGAGDWNIGTPFWDYWFPIAMYLAGARLRMLDIPVLLHLGHEQRWGDDEYNAGAALLWDALNAHSRTTMSGEILSQIRASLGADLASNACKVKQIAMGIVPWLYLQAETICLSNEGMAGDFLSRVLMGLEGSEEWTLRHQLETVTLSKWLRSKRGAARRLGDRIRRRLPSPILRSQGFDSSLTAKE